MTISDAFAAADVAAAPVPQSERAGVRAHARARLPQPSVTIKGRSGMALRTVRADVRNAWVWRGSPPSLAELAASRAPTADVVPAGHGGLRRGWWAYNHLVAIPVTAVSYFLTWLVQHPARLILAVALAAPLVITYFVAG